jgi:hypothetical protein
VIYRVKASTLRLRIATGTDDKIAVLYRVPRDTLLQTDLLVDAANQTLRTGYDDPDTPQPARVSSAWLRVVAFMRADGLWQYLKTPVYAALEWCEVERTEAGYPL